MSKKDMTYSIGMVAKIVGIPKYKLRNWCDKYLTHISKIEIGNTQHRRFTEKDIQIIKRIDQLMRDGHTLKSAVEKAIKQYKEE